MSSEFSCDYCSACPRHPCHSESEAADCPNQVNPGAYRDYSATAVAEWLEDRARILEGDEQEAALVTARALRRSHWL